MLEWQLRVSVCFRTLGSAASLGSQGDNPCAHPQAGMLLAGGGQCHVGKAVFSSQKHRPKPWQIPSVLIWGPAQCHLRKWTVTSAVQKDPLQLGRPLVLGETAVPFVLCRTSSLIAIHCHCPCCSRLPRKAGPAGTSNPWEQGKNVAWNRLVWVKLIPSRLRVENPLGLWQLRIVSPSPPYMGHFKINQQGSISWKEKEMFQSVSLQTDLLPPGSAYFKKCLELRFSSKGEGSN